MLKRWKALLGAEASWFHWTRQMLAYDKTSMQQQLIKALMKTGARDKAEQIGLKGKASCQDSFKQKSDWRQRGWGRGGRGGGGFFGFRLQCFTSFLSEITAFYVLICIPPAILRSAASPFDDFGTIFSLRPCSHRYWYFCNFWNSVYTKSIYNNTLVPVHYCFYSNNWYGDLYSRRFT